MRTAWILGVSLLLSGCGAHLADLPSDARSKFNQCWPSIERQSCGTATDPVNLNACRTVSGDDYAEREDQEARDRWLVQHGCAESMVYPEAQ